MSHEDKVGRNILVTTHDWFYAPDGRQYKAAWGTLNAIEADEKTLGIRTNARSTNWYMRLGNMTIAGCQVFYVVDTNKVNFGDVEDFNQHEGQFVLSTRPSAIYNANEESQ